MSLAQSLCHTTRDQIQHRFSLNEVGAPYLSLTSPMSPAPVGVVRLYTGGPIRKMVYIGLTVPPIGLDSHMIFAFTEPDSLVPHFTLDSVLAGPHFAFHLDLIPRVDLGANLAYLNEVFQPLTAHFDVGNAIAGLTPAHLAPRQYAIMSPWMFTHRATEAAFAQIEATVANYLSHWFVLVQDGVTATAVGLDPAERDRRNRAAIFSPEVDPVWTQVERLVGPEVGARLREILKNQEMEE